MSDAVLNDTAERAKRPPGAEARSPASDIPPTQDAHAGGVEGVGRKDVWSRSGSTYRVRAVVLLAINVLLFAGVGSFAFWLRSGERLAPLREGYGELLTQTFLSLRIVGYGGVSLGSLLLEPIDVQDVPLQIPIVGLLMASLISIPILVSILYRFWSSLPFIAVVAFLAVMPWLALALLGSCLIASVRPFRHRYRFMSALFGLLPAVVYLCGAWVGTTEDVVGRIDPVDRIKFIAPWVLAIVAATVVFALVLITAKIVDYRPGAIAPLLAVMLGIPVAMFEVYVGRDELYYRLLERDYASRFADVDASLDLEQAVEVAWARRSPPRGDKQAVRDLVETQWLFGLTSELRPYETAVTWYQNELVDRCDRFLHQFPGSRYAPNVLFIRAETLDTRVDFEAFRQDHWIRYHHDFPSVASWNTWRKLQANSPDSLLGAAALLRLAQLEAREGDVERAARKLTLLVRRFDARLDKRDTEFPATVQARGVMTRGAPEGSLGIPLERILLEAHRLRDLIAHNRDPLYGYDPLSGTQRRDDEVRFGLLDLNPRHKRYVANLAALRAHYPRCQLEDNIDLEIAKATPDAPARIRRLRTLLAAFPRGDAAPEALFRLALVTRTHRDSQAGREAFARLFRDFPDSIWARQASRYVEWTPSSVAVGTRP